jgi:formylmethanofuran dehydrogenase subunit E
MPRTDASHVNAIEELSKLHARLCPRQVLGLRIGRYAGELLGMGMPRSDKRMIATVEIDGCFADGVSVATGCWLGRRTLRVVDYGKVAATFFDVQTEVAVRIWPAVDARARAEHFARAAPDRWHAQLAAYQVMPATQLLKACHVRVNAKLFSTNSARLTCAGCGEEIFNQRNVVREGLVLCRACAGDAYYTSVHESPFQACLSKLEERIDR